MAKLTLDLPDESLTRLRERAQREGRSLEALAQEAILQSVANSADPMPGWEERWHVLVETIRSASETLSAEEAEREAVAAVREVRHPA